MTWIDSFPSLKSLPADVGFDLVARSRIVSRILGEFHRRAFLETVRGEIRITNRPGLERIARSVT